MRGGQTFLQLLFIGNIRLQCGNLLLRGLHLLLNALQISKLLLLRGGLLLQRSQLLIGFSRFCFQCSDFAARLLGGFLRRSKGRSFLFDLLVRSSLLLCGCRQLDGQFVFFRRQGSKIGIQGLSLLVLFRQLRLELFRLRLQNSQLFALASQALLQFLRLGLRRNQGFLSGFQRSFGLGKLFFQRRRRRSFLLYLLR